MSIWGSIGARPAHRAGARRATRAARRSLLALLLVPGLVLPVAMAPSASAVVTLVKGFEIDGDTPLNAGGIDDWDSLTYPPTPDAEASHATDPTGDADTTNFSGSKEFEHPTTWVRQAGVAPNQDDVAEVFHYARTVDSAVWSYVGFRRLTAEGNTNFDVEYNQLPNVPANSFVPQRSVNDLMIRFEQEGQGSSEFRLELAYVWEQKGTLADDAADDWDDKCIEVPGYPAPGYGWCEESAAGAGFVGETGENGLFAEGGFNLSSFFGSDPNDCRGAFGTMNLRSFTGNDNQSALKDYIEPVKISVPPSCGSLKIEKHNQFEGEVVPGMTFTIAPNPVPGQTGTLEVTDGGQNDPDNTANGVIVINPAKPGSYTVTEVVPAGDWPYIPPAQLSQTKTLAPGSTASVVFTFVNTEKFAPLGVRTTVTPSKLVDYDWKVEKSVDKARADVPSGTKATFSYTVDLKAMGRTDSGWQVGGRVEVSNTNARAIPATLSLSSTGADSCVFNPDPDVAPGTPGTQVVVAANASPAYTFTCTPEPGHDGGSVTATVTWDGTTYPSSDADATVSSVAGYTAGDYAVRGETDKSTTVTDTFGGGAPTTLGTVTWDDTWTGLPKVVKSWSYPREIAGEPGKCTDYRNVAEESADGTSDQETVTVCVGVDLTVDKIATLAFDREYLWKVKKTGPGQVFVGANGGTATYDVLLETNGYRDHDWKLGGTIWISNDNAWPVDAHIEDVTTIDGTQLTCTITGGADVTVPAGADKQPYGYTCTGIEEQGAYDGKNKVSVTWDKTEYFTPTGSATHEVAVSVSGVGAAQHKTVSLSDVFDGGAATPVGATSYDWDAVKANPVTVTYTRPVTAAAGQCRTYVNTVTVVGPNIPSTATTEVCQPGIAKSVQAEYGQRQTWTLEKKVDKTFVELGPTDTVTFNYTVTATPGPVVDEGQARWGGTITVTNPSSTTAFDGTVTDTPAVAGWTCSVVGDGKVSIQPGKSAIVSYTCSTAGTAHPDGKNTATVSWPGHSTATTVDVKFASTGTIDTKTTLTDDIPNDSLPAKEFAVDAGIGVNVLTYSNSTLTAGAGKCVTYTNNAVLAVTGEDPTASVPVTVCREAPLTVEVDGQGGYGVTYPWTVEKDLAEPSTVEVDAETGEAEFDYTVTVRALDKQPADWTMGGTVTVTNPNTYAEGSIKLTDLDVTTDLGGGAACTPVMPADPTLDPGESLPIAYTCTFTGEPATSGKVTAVAEWDPTGADPSDTATSAPAPVALVLGAEVDKTIEVWDDRTDPENPELLDTLTWEEDGEWEFPYSLTHSAEPGTCRTYTNEAWIETAGEDPRAGITKGETVQRTTAEICAEAPLTASMAASGGLARDYAWSIDKSVDRTAVTVTGGTATFSYTVVVRAGASKDSAWRASGVLTVANPNAYGDSEVDDSITLTGSTFTTTFGPGVTCAPDGAVAGRTVPAGGSIEVPFTCTFAIAPSTTSGTIAAQVAWDPAGDATSDTAGASTGVALGLDKETNKVVDVVDDKTVPGQRVVLEKGLVWSPGLVRTYTYSLALPAGAAGSTTSYTNIATVDLPQGPDLSDTVTVTVSVPEVAPEQAFGKATGKVRASCQGTVTARMRNATGGRVTYVLKVGKKTHRIQVASGKRKVFQTKGRARARVVLKVGPQTLDRVRVPNLCLPPEVLPETGMRTAANARLGSITHRWG